MFEIQENVPLPPPRSNGAEYELREKIKARLKSVQAGQSFVVPVFSKTLRAVILMTAKRYGVFVRTRKEGDGLRVWILRDKPTR
jgi:hypothetical protein